RIQPYARVEAEPGGGYSGGEFLAYVADTGPGKYEHGYVPEIYVSLTDIASDTTALDNKIARATDATKAAGRAVTAAINVREEYEGHHQLQLPPRPGGRLAHRHHRHRCGAGGRAGPPRLPRCLPDAGHHRRLVG